MVQLVKYFNENYGQQYGNIDYPKTKKEIYQTYQIIKSYGIKDYTLMNLLNEVVLPKPTSTKEREMYSECLYEVSDNGSLLNDLIYKRTPFLKLTKDDFEVIEVGEGGGKHDCYVYKQSPKIDWLDCTEKSIEKLGYNIYIKVERNDEIRESEINEFINKIRLQKDENSDNIFYIIGNGMMLIPKGELDFENSKIIDGDYFTIFTSLDLNMNLLELELELFKIDSIPTYNDSIGKAYTLVLGKDGKVYKESQLSS